MCVDDKDLEQLAQEVLSSDQEIGSGLPTSFQTGYEPINLDGSIVFGQ